MYKKHASTYSCFLTFIMYKKLRYCKPLFTITLFLDLLEINWFAAIRFHVKDVHYLENKTPQKFEDWFMGRNICNNEALMNLQKFLALE